MTLTDQIKQPTRGGNNNIHALAQRLHLRMLAHAAENHGNAESKIFPIRAKIPRDLRRKLARRTENQTAGASAAPGNNRSRSKTMKNRQRERRRFSCARLSTAEQIPAFKYVRNRLRLNRRSNSVAFRGNGAEQGLREPQFNEFHERSFGGQCAPEGPRLNAEEMPVDALQLGSDQSGMCL